MHAQSSLGRRTVTVLAAPVADGTVSPIGSPIVGMLEGEVDNTDLVYWPDPEGICYAIDTTEGNFLMFYKSIDQLPYNDTDTVEWSDAWDMAYASSALSFALGTEDDEYDRYRAWMYDFLASNTADTLRNMAINAKLK